MPRKVKTVPPLAKVLASIAETQGRHTVIFKYAQRNHSLYGVRGLRRVDEPGVVDVLMRTSQCAIPEIMRLYYVRSEACLLNDADLWPEDAEPMDERVVVIRPDQDFDRLTLVTMMLGGLSAQLTVQDRGHIHSINAIHIEAVIFEDEATKILGSVVTVDGLETVLLTIELEEPTGTLQTIKVSEAEPVPA